MNAFPIGFSTWKVAPVEAEPTLYLTSWSILEVEAGTRHFVGYNLDGCEGRTSSAIATIDVEKRRGVTKSGRVYELEGEPGHNPDARYTWSQWCQINDVATSET